MKKWKNKILELDFLYVLFKFEIFLYLFVILVKILFIMFNLVVFLYSFE